MRRFQKAIAVVLIALFLLYAAASAFIKKEGGQDLSREKSFDSYRVSLITGGPALTGQETLLGYYFEDANGTEIPDVYYVPGKELQIRRDNILTNDSGDFSKIFSLHKRNRPSLGIGYRFNESGVYTITSEFEHKNKTIITDFLIQVKTREKYYEEQIKGESIIIIMFIILVLLGIYVYEKLEKPIAK